MLLPWLLCTVFNLLEKQKNKKQSGRENAKN
jgi:hypothetical protein